MNGFDTVTETSEEHKSDVRIGRILLAKGLISDEHLADALELQRNKKARLGEILVFIGACRDIDIDSALKLQESLFF
jgi:hypothetical protein